MQLNDRHPVPPEETLPVRPVRIERAVEDPKSALIAALMDTAFVIPGTNIRFGFDALIGLFPGVGDAVGALISTAMIARASHLGVPKIVLARMAGNILINAIVGALPILGGVLTVFYRSNAKNYDLLQRHAGGVRTSTGRDWIFVSGLVLAILAVLTLLVVGGVVLARQLFRGVQTWF